MIERKNRSDNIKNGTIVTNHVMLNINYVMYLGGDDYLGWNRGKNKSSLQPHLRNFKPVLYTEIWVQDTISIHPVGSLSPIWQNLKQSLSCN